MAHRRPQPPAPPVDRTELAVAIAPRLALGGFLPQQVQRHAGVCEFAVDPRAIRPDPLPHRRRPGEQPSLQRGVVEVGGERPAQAQRRGPFQIERDRPDADRAGRATARWQKRSCLSRRTSRIFLIDSLGGIATSSLRGRSVPPRYRRFTIVGIRVHDARNRCSTSRNPCSTSLESVFNFARNRWILRNTQPRCRAPAAVFVRLDRQVQLRLAMLEPKTDDFQALQT